MRLAPRALPNRLLLPAALPGLLFGAQPDTTATDRDPLPPLDEYQVRLFTVADGIPASDVRDVAQGADGYVYVAGWRGLVRFDGHRFQPVPLEGFEDGRIDYLHSDPGGRLWVLSAGNDLGLLEDDRVRALPPPPGRILGLPRTEGRPLWLGSAVGLIRVDPEAAAPYRVLTRRDGLPSDTVLGVVDLPDGERVVVTRWQLARMERDRAEGGAPRFHLLGPRREVPGGPLRRTYLVDRSGLWLTTADGLVRYTGGSVTEYTGADAPDLDDVDWPAAATLAPYGVAQRLRLAGMDPAPSGARARQILRDRNGNRWIVVGSPADDYVLLREREGRFDRMELHARLEVRAIRDLLEDHEGSIWVPTDRGLFQLSPRRVASLGRRHGLAQDFTTGLYQDPEGSFWVATWGGGLHRFVGGRLDRRFTTADGLPDDRVRCLFRTRDGGLLVGTQGGVARIEGDRVAWADGNIGSVRAIAETEEADGSTRVWLASGPDLLTGRPGDLRPFRPDVEWGLRIWALHVAADGALWVGGTGGLFRVLGDSVRAFGPEDGLRGQHVSSIHEEADGTIWIGTYEDGLHRYRGDRLIPITNREGLYQDGVWAMLDDGRGYVWMSSDGGIFRVSRARLHAVADALEEGLPPDEFLEPLVFTEAEGSPSRESNRASPAGWRLADGRLVFNNLSGVVVIDPERAARPPPPPRTRIQGVRADGREVPLHPTEAARLSPGVRHVTFQFAALSFVTPEQSRYRFRLDGYDEGWVDGGSGGQAAYTGLDPGTYIFHVQGATGAGPWSDEEASYAFVVPPFLWQTWWFRGMLALAAAGVLALAYRARVSRLLAMERLRLRIASDLHDDVSSNLSSIAMLSEMLRDRTRLEGLERRQLERISRAAGETIGSLREIIWLVDPKHDNVADLVRRMRHTASDLLNGTAVTFAHREPLDRRPLDPEFVRQVFLIYKEALHNVAKHSGAGRVRVEVGAERGMFVMRIEDDGAGFQEGEVARGLGLESMRRRAEEVGGELRIESPPGGGTCIAFRGRMA